MRDYGKVFTTIWASADFRALSEDGRTLVLYLLTCPHGTMTGTFRLPNGYCCEDLQWTAERVSEGFANASTKGFATRCAATNWVWITKHLDWNPPENPNQRKAGAKLVNQIPDACAWKPAFMRACGHILGIEVPDETPPPVEPLANPLPTVTEPVSVSGAVTGAGVTTEPSGSVGDAKPADPPAPPPPPPAPTKAEKRAARKAPADFEVTDEMRAWAAEKAPHADVDGETEAFKDHTFKDSKLDWPGTWRNWLRAANKRNPQRHRPVAKSFAQADYDAKVDRVNRMTGGLAGAKPAQADFIDMEVPRGAVAEIR